MKRSVFIAGLSALLVASLAGTSFAQFGGGRGKGKKSGVAIGKASLSPKRLPGSGGSVSVSVPIRAKGVTITGATVEAVGGSATVLNGPTAGGTFTGTVGVPANTDLKRAKAVKIKVTVQHSSGTTSKFVGAVKVDKGTGGGGGTGDRPPDPPNI